MRKPGIPPARIPEITKSSHQGMTFTLTLNVGPLPGHYRISAQRTMWAGFAALGRSRLNSRKHNWTAPVELTAVQPSPWLYRESTAPLGKNAETKQSEKDPSQHSQRKSHKTQPNQKQTNSKGKQGEGGTVTKTPHLNHSNGSRPPARKPTNSATARNTSSNDLRAAKG